MRKQPSHPRYDEPVTIWLERLSKGALIDCLLDALDLQIGEAAPPWAALDNAISFCGPRLNARGDRIPKVPGRGRTP
jgi:hypothetical protein